MDVVSVTPHEWQQFVEAQPDYSFFQLPIWALAYQVAFPNCKVVTKLFSFDDGNKILIPVVETNIRLGLRYYESLPRGGYGGLIYNGEFSSKNMERVIRYFISSRTYHFSLFPDPRLWGKFTFLSKLGFRSIESFTHILQLESMEILWKKISKERKRNIRVAERNNIEFTQGKMEDLGIYYQIYLDSTNRWGIEKRQVIPLLFFQELLRLGRDRVRLFFVQKGEHKIAGGIVVYGKKESFVWETAFRYEFRNMYPNGLLHWGIILDSLNRGYETYNLGASIGLPGVERFKEGFGAQRLDYKYFVYFHPFYRMRNKLDIAFSFGRKRANPSSQ